MCQSDSGPLTFQPEMLGMSLHVQRGNPCLYYGSTHQQAILSAILYGKVISHSCIIDILCFSVLIHLFSKVVNTKWNIIIGFLNDSVFILDPISKYVISTV